MPPAPDSAVRAVITLADGSQQTLEITAIRLTLGGAPLELSFGGGDYLHLITDGSEERWHQLVVYPGASNTVTIGSRVIEDNPKPPQPRRK